MSDDARALLTGLADALDAVLAADETHRQRADEQDAYIRELEADNVRLTQAHTALVEQGKESAVDYAALATELKGANRLLRAAEKQLAEIRRKEVDPLAEQVVRLMAEMSVLRDAASTAESNAIAYRFPGDGAPDIVVRWRGGEWWSVTDGANRVWTVQQGWVDGRMHSRTAPPDARFSRADALMHAQVLAQAAREKTREMNP